MQRLPSLVRRAQQDGSDYDEGWSETEDRATVAARAAGLDASSSSDADSSSDASDSDDGGDDGGMPADLLAAAEAAGAY